MKAISKQIGVMKDGTIVLERDIDAIVAEVDAELRDGSVTLQSRSATGAITTTHRHRKSKPVRLSVDDLPAYFTNDLMKYV